MIYEIMAFSTGLLNKNEKRPQMKAFPVKIYRLYLFTRIYLRNAYRAHSRYCSKLFLKLNLIFKFNLL